MKNLILACVLILSSVSVLAQHTKPRFGTASNQDKTYRPLTLAWGTLADTGGSTVDTIKIIPNAHNTIYTMTLTDSCVLAFNSIADSWIGDVITIHINNTTGSGHFVNFLGTAALATKWGTNSSSTKVSPASTKNATIGFQFDGSKWNELYRTVQ